MGAIAVLSPQVRRVVKRVVTIMLLGWVLLSSTALASHATLRERIWKTDPCLAWIVDHEDGTWDPQRYGAGLSYGIPQANPGAKMSIAGRDWRTNPYTQLRWMRWYVGETYKRGVTVYRGACDAKAHWLVYHSY